MKKWNWLALLLCLMLPVCAMATTEGKVEDAPMVDVQSTVQSVSYLPDASYYAGGTYTVSWENAEAWVENEQDEYGDYRDMTQSPRLTAGEAKRAQALLDAYKAGEKTYTGESVLEKMEQVTVGVYALNPADYDGETAFVLLPGTCLTDDQLLSIIAAFDQMGQTFDPNGLNYRNCARGGGIETSRFLTDEERERYNYMGDCIRRGQLEPPADIQKLEGIIRNPHLESKYFSGLEDFSIKPYRSMTDAELIFLLKAMGVHDESGEIDYNGVVSRARTAFYTKLGCPMSMELENVFSGGMYTPVLFTADGRIAYDYDNPNAAYGATFTYVNGNNIKVNACIFFDKETGEIVKLDAMDDSITPHYAESDDNDDAITDAVTEEKIETVLAQIEARLNLPKLDWHIQWDNEIFTNWGLCVPVCAQVENGCLMTVYIGGDDGSEHGLQLQYGTLVDVLPEE